MPQPRRRVLFVSHEMTLSGAPIQLAYLINWLREHGWETTVVTPEPGPLAEKLPEVDIIYESQLLIDPSYGALRRLAPQFDAVVANTIVTWEAVQACHLEKVPVIWYIHETQLGLELMKLVHMMEPSLELADAVIIPTHTTGVLYAPFRSAPVEVIAYGIPAATPLPRVSHEHVNFALIATLEPRKGQDVLLEAVAQLPEEAKARSRFRIAGRELDQPFSQALRERAAQFNNIQLLGALNHDEALRLLTQTDVLVCASRDETMPIVLLEAMSLGKAIICSKVGGINEWLHDGVNGLLVPADDPAALSLAIQRLIGDATLRGQLGIAGRETFDRHFTIDRFGEQFAGVISEVIVRRLAPSA